MRRLAALMLVAMPGAAAAQDVIFDIAPTASCVAEGNGEVCIGAATSACFNANDAGFTTSGILQCIGQEHTWWDARLNRVYAELKADLAARDADTPDAPEQARALVEMQRAWIPYRDARCLFDRSEWGNGTAAGTAHASCMLELTAQQALLLEERMQEG